MEDSLTVDVDVWPAKKPLVRKQKVAPVVSAPVKQRSKPVIHEKITASKLK